MCFVCLWEGTGLHVYVCVRVCVLGGMGGVGGLSSPPLCPKHFYISAPCLTKGYIWKQTTLWLCTPVLQTSITLLRNRMLYSCCQIDFARRRAFSFLKCFFYCYQNNTFHVQLYWKIKQNYMFCMSSEEFIMFYSMQLT